MSSHSIQERLSVLLHQCGIDPSVWKDSVPIFSQKLEFLSQLQRYNGLLKSLFSSRDQGTLKSHIFEVLYAYDFEKTGNRLEYEVRQMSTNQSSVDFYYEMDEGEKIFFELGLMQQKRELKDLIDSQLKEDNVFVVRLDGTAEKETIVRLQHLVLSKCRDEKGNPIKFDKVTQGVYNFVVAHVSELQLGLIDRHDCKLAMYGNEAVESIYRRGVFGICQDLPNSADDREKGYHTKFRPFRNRIHGVLFVKNRTSRSSTIFMDSELQYLLLRNTFLLSLDRYRSINRKLSSFLRGWDTEP